MNSFRKKANNMADTLLSIQILPKSAGSDQELYALVDQAIAIIEESGVPYRVGPLETTMEGELPELLNIVEKMNRAMILAGCPSVISQVKILHKPTGASMSELTQKYD